MTLRVAAALAILVAVGDGLPIVDPGLFVIMGVRTCGDGDGYCLLGTDCTLDDDFVPDVRGGHCDGLRNAFTPSAPFVCCRYNAKPSNVSTTTSKTTDAETITTAITALASESTAIDASTMTKAPTTTTTTQSSESDAEQDWSPIAGPFPVFGQDVKEVELDVSIPVGHRTAGSTTSDFVETLGLEGSSGLENASVTADSAEFEDTSGSEASSVSVVSSVSTSSSDSGAILGLGDESAVDPATRERWLLGRLRKRQEIRREDVGL